MRISDWSSDVCSSDLARRLGLAKGGRGTLEDAQAAAATGQIALSQVWAEVLGAEGLTAAQMLVTLGDLEHQIGRASCRERVCPYVYISVVAVSFKKKKTKQIRDNDN